MTSIRHRDARPSKRGPRYHCSRHLIIGEKLSLEKIKNVFVPVIGRHYRGEILTETGNLATLDKVETRREVRGVAKGDFFGRGEIYAGWSRSVEREPSLR